MGLASARRGRRRVGGCDVRLGRQYLQGVLHVLDAFDSARDRFDLAALLGAVDRTGERDNSVGDVDGNARDRRGADLRGELRLDLRGNFRIVGLPLQALVGAAGQRKDERGPEDDSCSDLHGALRRETGNGCASTVAARRARDLRLSAHRPAARPKGLDRGPGPWLRAPLPRRAPPPSVTSGDYARRDRGRNPADVIPSAARDLLCAICDWWSRFLTLRGVRCAPAAPWLSRIEKAHAASPVSAP